MNRDRMGIRAAISRVAWPWLGLLAVVAAMAAAGAALLPGLSHRLDAALHEAAGRIARESGLSVSIGPSALTFPAGVHIAGVRVAWEQGGGVYVPGIRLAVDLPQALAHPTEPVKSVRRIEASGVVIRPGQADPAGQPGPEDADGSPHPASLSERVAQLRRAVIDLLDAMPAALEWMAPGDVLSWRLDGVWEEPGVKPGEWIRTPWRTSGDLRAGGEGRLEAQGTVEVGGLRCTFVAAATSGGIEVRRMAVEQPGFELSAVASVERTQGGGLDLSTSGTARWASPMPGAGAFEARWQARGPWTPRALPAVEFAFDSRPARPDAGGWARLLGAASGTLRVVQDAGGVALQDGVLQKRAARGRFSGRVEDAWPHATRIDFEVSGLEPGVDVPWWPPHSVSSVSARGRLSGSVGGGWAVDGEVQAPSGRLLDLAVGGATARVSVDFAAGRAIVDELVTAAGSGLLTLSAQVLWGPSAPVVAGRVPSATSLDLRGKLENLASTELLTAARAALRHAGVATAPAGPPAREPRGDVTGSFEARLAWLDTGAGGAGMPGVILDHARFDGPDGTLSVVQQEPGRYALQADLVNLGGRALRPWLEPWRGYAAFSGELRQGVLQGRLAVRSLGVGGFELGDLVAPVSYAGGYLEAPGAQLAGGEVEGALTLRLRLDLGEGTARFRLGQRRGVAPGAAAEGALELSGPALTLRDVLVSVQGREVARLDGRIPLPGPGGGPGEAMDVRARMERFPLELLAQLLPSWRVEGGRLSGELALTGPPQAATASGRISLMADRMTAPGDRLTPLTGLALELDLKGRTVRVVRGRVGSAEGGEVRLSGGATLASVLPLRFDPVDLRAEVVDATLGARPSDTLELHGTLAGQLRWAGVLGGGNWPTLSGELGVVRGRAVFWGITAAGSGGAAGAGREMVRLPEVLERAEGRPAAAPGIPLDIAVVAREPVDLEVPALGGRALAEGRLHLTGTTRSPALEGEMTLSQARLRYFGREFAIERGRLTFSPSRGVLPELDLEATTGTPEGPVRVRAQGTGTDPTQLRLTAQPEMTREQILALLLGGPAPADGTSQESWLSRINEQLAAWAMGPLEEAVRTALGLDELILLPGGEEGTLRLLAGKYLTPSRVYVRYRRELLQPAATQELELAFRLRPDLTWTLWWDDRGTFRLGLNWQRSF